MNEYKKEFDYYKGLNNLADKGGVVFFGSTFAKNIPVSELGQGLTLTCGIFNRSFTDLSVFDAAELVDTAVMELQPRKVILQLGETDMERGYKSVTDIIDAYEKLILKLKKSDKRLKIVMASVCSGKTDCSKLNSAIEALANKCKCQYADITKAGQTDMAGVKAFGMLKCFLLDHLTFCDAMSFA